MPNADTHVMKKTSVCFECLSDSGRFSVDRLTMICYGFYKSAFLADVFLSELWKRCIWVCGTSSL